MRFVCVYSQCTVKSKYAQFVKDSFPYNPFQHLSFPVFYWYGESDLSPVFFFSPRAWVWSLLERCRSSILLLMVTQRLFLDAIINHLEWEKAQFSLITIFTMYSLKNIYIWTDALKLRARAFMIYFILCCQVHYYSFNMITNMVQLCFAAQNIKH